MASSSSTPQVSVNEITIPLPESPGLFILGPTDFINLETNRLPFKHLSDPVSSWKDAFRSWPTAIAGWRDWYLRMSSKWADWDTYQIGQCLTLSLSDIKKNEPLLIAASHFWSDALNAFLFGHGPMSPTLLDVVMLTGLNITSTTRFDTLAKPTHIIKVAKIGWKDYISTYSKKQGPIDQKEYSAFLLMWLEKFVFCGKAFAPCVKYQKVVEHLASGNLLPLGKYLLGSVYQLLHEVSIRLRKGEPISCLGGPWWFINLWLNLHMHKAWKVNLFNQSFPSDQSLGNKIISRRCTSFGEAAAVLNGDKMTPNRLAAYFNCFYNGLSKSALVWFAYEDPNNSFENPIIFQLDSILLDDSMKLILKEMIRPNILPVACDEHTYEFYYPSVVARQLGFVQAPIKLYFSDLIGYRTHVENGLAFCRLLDRIPDLDMSDLNTWKLAGITSIATSSFKSWWAEWCQYLFCEPALSYCKIFDPDFSSKQKENRFSPPETSKSGRPIQYAPATDTPHIRYNAPSAADILKGKTVKRRTGTSSKKTTKRIKIAPVNTNPIHLPSIAEQEDIGPIPPQAPQQDSPASSLNHPERNPAEKMTDQPSEELIIQTTEDHPQQETEVTIPQQIPDNQTGTSVAAEQTQSDIHPISSPRQPTQFDEVNLKQAEDSIDNSLFDFPIKDLLSEEEVQSADKRTSSTTASHPTETNIPSFPEDVKNKLSDLQVLLEQDTYALVQDACPIRSILHQLRPHLNRQAQAAIIPAAYIETRQIEFIEARQKLSDQQNRESLIKESEQKRDIANATKDKIRFLESSRSSMVAKIDTLKARKEALTDELQSVDQQLEKEEKRLQDLPALIDNLQKTLKAQALDALKLHKSIPAEEGLIETHQRVIDDVNQIRLRALNAVRSLL